MIAGEIGSTAETARQALWEVSLLLLKSPHAALERIGHILAARPGDEDALILFAKAHRACGAPDLAERAVAQILAKAPDHPAALRELALVRLLQRRGRDAADLIARALSIEPEDAGGWSVLADIRRASGDAAGAEAATQRSIAAAVGDPACLAPALALAEERLPDAERLLRVRLSDYPTEVVTIRMMAELATRLGRFPDAEKLLRRALEIAPGFQPAREMLARNLQRCHRPLEALEEVDRMLADDGRNPSVLMLKASLLVKTGDQEKARDVYEQVLADHPRQAKTWMSLGHVLKTLGRQKDGIAAYRRAIAEQPTLGEAWWSLANLKTVRFDADDIAAMDAALAQSTDDDDRLHLRFALGKAQEDRGDHGAAFAHWVEGNAIRRASLDYDADETHRACARAKAFFDPATLASEAGHPAADPIFIVGMPRSGSTLVEQILASHSQVEGTMELPDMMEIAARLAQDAARASASYPETLAALSADERVALGQEYLDRTRIHRKLGRPFFIDKMPNNWAHVGLIRAILPNARIIDTRRHPLGCCLSMWKQHFARGQGFSYDLDDLARYYLDYADLMDHFDRARPGLVHRVVYERMVADSETEVRRLLDHLGLAFEDACLSFWQNDRAVRTASSEQVRQPIFSDAVDHWRHFEPWLEPLRQKLGGIVDDHASLR